MDETDREEAKTEPTSHQRLKELGERKVKYEELLKKLEESSARQISTTDEDARALALHMNIVEVSYNIQTSVDDKHNLIAEYEVTNEKDNNALVHMARKTKEGLDIPEEETITALADKGYYKGEQLHDCHENNIETIVAIHDQTDKTKAEHVRKEQFEYKAKDNTYRCPSGQTLQFQARYKRRKGGKEVGEFDRYAIRHSICKECRYYQECVSEAKKTQSQGRCIDRSIYQDAIDRNAKNVETRKGEYKRRQAIVEHPFGTIKRGWGFSYTLMKTIPKVETEFSIIFLCYKLRRTMSILELRPTMLAHNNRNILYYLLPDEWSQRIL